MSLLFFRAASEIKKLLFCMNYKIHITEIKIKLTAAI